MTPGMELGYPQLSYTSWHLFATLSHVHLLVSL